MENISKKLLLVAVCAFSAIYAKGLDKVVYFIPPAGYQYKNDRFVTETDQVMDDFSLAVAALKGNLRANGYDLAVTSVDSKFSNFAGLIACHFPQDKLKKLAKFPRNKLIFLATEPLSFEHSYYKHFGKVFTMQDDQIDSATYFKYYYPVAGLEMNDSLLPFSERKLCASLPTCESLNNYKFCLCYESDLDMEGMITCKIFDAFKAGCVPVYWGAPNITDYVPAHCFIDRRDFSTDGELPEFLGSINQAQYDRYVENIKNFLKSSQASYFAQESFVNMLLNHLAIPTGKAHEDEAEDAPLIVSTIIGQSNIHSGEKITLSVITDGGKSPLYYKWSDGQQGVDLSAIQISPKKNTEYTVTVSDSSEYEETSLPFIVKVEGDESVIPSIPTATEILDDNDDEDGVSRDDREEDQGDEPASEESDYVEEQAEDEQMLASLAIEGETTYKYGQIIQLRAYPEGVTYNWSGPNGFASTARNISLIAKPEAAGLYILKAKTADKSKTVSAMVTVLGKDNSPATTPAAPIVAPAKTESKASKDRIKTAVVVKGSNYKVKDDTLTFTVSVINAGREEAADLRVATVLPSCLELISVQGNGWSIKTSPHDIKAKLPALKVLEQKSFEVRARIVRKPSEAVSNEITVTGGNFAMYTAKAWIL